MEIQIVCKVPDPDVLLGGVSKEFNNVVSLQNSKGTTIGNDSNGVTIGKQTLSKQGTYNPETNGGRYPFKITLNELGEDLVSGSDTITLVDELSNTCLLYTSAEAYSQKVHADADAYWKQVAARASKLLADQEALRQLIQSAGESVRWRG